MSKVDHPKHYNNHPSGIEYIEVTRHMNFNLGNVIKYCWRFDDNGGTEDLRKALWYLRDEIDRRAAYEDNEECEEQLSFDEGSLNFGPYPVKKPIPFSSLVMIAEYMLKKGLIDTPQQYEALLRYGQD